MVKLASHNLSEPRASLRTEDQLTVVAGKHLRSLEGLGEESVTLPGSGNLDLVFLRQLIHNKDSNVVLDISDNVVVLISNDIGVHDTAGGIKGIHSRVDSKFSNRSGQDSDGRVKIFQVLSGHVDGLHGGDR